MVIIGLSLSLVTLSLVIVVVGVVVYGARTYQRREQSFATAASTAVPIPHEGNEISSDASEQRLSDVRVEPSADDTLAEDFRWYREYRSYFGHPSIPVRIPYPKGWQVAIDKNDDDATSISFTEVVHPDNASSDRKSFSFFRQRKTMRDWMSKIRNADVLVVHRSGMEMSRVEHLPFLPPLEIFDPSNQRRQVSYVWQQGDFLFGLHGFADDSILGAATAILVFAPTVIPDDHVGVIEGSLSYPSEVILSQKICAEETERHQVFCTTAHIIDDERYLNGEGYRIAVPPGRYVVSATNEENRSRAYYSQQTICGEKQKCPTYSPAIVDVDAGKLITGIDPDDWDSVGAWENKVVQPD